MAKTQDYIRLVNATIAAAGSLSAAVDIGAYSIVGIQMPAAWTAANLTFQVSDDNVTYYNAYDEVGEISLATAAGVQLNIPLYKLGEQTRYIKIRSGTAAVPVAQAAERVIKVRCLDLGS